MSPFDNFILESIGVFERVCKPLNHNWRGLLASIKAGIFQPQTPIFQTPIEGAFTVYALNFSFIKVKDQKIILQIVRNYD
ncbi:MAG: hypothetical protein ACTSR8_05390 [Promethearchaeota archaeon]